MSETTEKPETLWAAWFSPMSWYKRPQKVTLSEHNDIYWHSNGYDHVDYDGLVIPTLSSYPNGYGLVTFASTSKREVQTYMNFAKALRGIVAYNLGFKEE